MIYVCINVDQQLITNWLPHTLSAVSRMSFLCGTLREKSQKAVLIHVNKFVITVILQVPVEFIVYCTLSKSTNLSVHVVPTVHSYIWLRIRAITNEFTCTEFLCVAGPH